MKFIFTLGFLLVLAKWIFLPVPVTGPVSNFVESKSSSAFVGTCDSVTIFAQLIRTVPPSCCFQLIIDNKLKNAITQIKLDINTATFTNIIVQTNAGWIASQTLQKDILLSHNSGFIPVGGSSPLSFCLKGGNNPDSLKISFNYSAGGAAGTCNINSLLCSDPAPCVASFNFQNINNCGNVQFSNLSTGTAPITYSWNFGDPNSGLNNSSTAQNPSHQFSACGNYLVCLKTFASGCTDSICKMVSFVDNINPVITCPPLQNLQCNANTNPPATGVATATDNCTATPAILITSSDVVTGILPCNATIVRTWTAKDACGNSSTCQQRIFIKDTTAPTIVCPANTVVNTIAGQCYYTGILPQPVVTDKCDQAPDITCSLVTLFSSILINGQTQFPKGINNITCFAKDDCGNQSQNCNFTLTVVDNQPPSITCPGNISVTGLINVQGLCKAIVNNIAPIANDNCPMLQMIYSITGATTGSGNNDASGTSFMLGVSTVTYTATDMGGNSKSCSFTITVSCPPPPKPKCDSVSILFTSQILPPFPLACLFHFTINNQATNISKVQMDLKTATFSGISGHNPYVLTSLVPNQVVFTHPSGTIPIGSFLAADINIAGGTNPDTAIVRFFYNNGLSSCDTNIIFNCPTPPPPKPKCDSVKAFLVPFQAIPYACTFQFHASNQATAITKIQIDLKTTSFNSAGIVSPFTPVISPASRLTITHSSGTIPIGNFHMADLGINIGSNPDTAIVKFFYNNGLSSCDTNLIFNCPVDSTCGYDPTCAVNSISLNTGVDDNGQLISPGSYDPNWMVTNSPYTGSILPSPAEVIQKYASWDFQPNAASSCSQWISLFQGATGQNNSAGFNPYSYSRCFCVCKDKAKITIQLSAMADNNANFRLYDALGNLVSPLLVISYPTNLPQAFQLPPDVSTTNLVLNKGIYCIRADVRNYANVTGINVCGSVSGEGLIKTRCCESNSYIVGHKYNDVNCNGLPFSTQPVLSGWHIVLCYAAGNAIDTVITDVNGYYGFGPIVPGIYSVKEINQTNWTLSNPTINNVQVQLDTHQVKEVNFGNCPPTTCDSISFWVETLKTIPPACCFRLHIDNLIKNKFTQIPLNLFSASFNSIVVDNFNGWFASQSNLSNINLTHSSGFIPVGSFTPISWCINNGSNPDTIQIKAEYLVGQSKLYCVSSLEFFCPPQPDTTCGIACKADSISLNTGVDHSTGLFYTQGSPDAYWTVVQTPYPLYILPKPAYAMTTPSFWHDQPSSSLPCSQWINFSGGPYHYDQGLYQFNRCFCICKDGARIQIHLSALVDNAVDFTLCDSTGATISHLLSASNFLRPPKDTTVLLILDKGKYCIKASVYNYGHTYTGFNVCGSIKGDGLVKEICCEPSSIIGVKYVDTLCTGVPFNGQQQTLQGWSIVLCNNQGVALDTVITDQNGSYSFNPLLPGLYKIKELNQAGWTPSLPATGMSSIFLGANQVAQVNFGNCPPEIDSCCKSKSIFTQHITNAVQLAIVDSICKAKINLRLPSCDSMTSINWGDGQVTQGPFSNGMWMHTYTQSGSYMIQMQIKEYGANGKPCFDTLLKFTIDIFCECGCGKFGLNLSQNGIIAPVRCNDTILLGCPAPKTLFIQSLFSCAGDSCLTPAFQWSIIGPAINLSGSLVSNVIIQFNIPAPLSPGYTTLNIQTVCGHKKCSCTITFYQPPCVIIDSCSVYCNGTAWNQLNTSLIQDMVVYQGKLIVAGQFNTIGNPAVLANNIAAWNGTSWFPLGSGLNNVVLDIEVHNGKLYAGGNFTLAGGNSVNNIAEWNGTSWSDIFQGGVHGITTNVDALLSTSSGLVVGGKFNSVGSLLLTASNIAIWNPNPSGWATLGGFNGPVFTLSIYNNKIVAGGRFGNSPGGLNNVGIWNGSFWDKLGASGAVNITLVPANSGDGVHALETFGNDLIVGGQFLNANPGIPNTQNIAKWNGSSWSALSTGVNSGPGIYDLIVANNELLAGGKFTVIGNQSINLLAKWNGTSWSSLNHPSIGIIRSMFLYRTNPNLACNLYTGGEILFNQFMCSGVNTKDHAPSISITVYPNPAKDQFFIQFNDGKQEDVRIEIYSMFGQSLLHQYSRIIPETATIDVHQLSTGTYFIKISTNKGTGVKKIVLNKQ